ncbi:MAG: YraN family protein [Armatimonadetes bacterium]|nr:YraN family protein [Armatimonadota bacterium]
MPGLRKLGAEGEDRAAEFLLQHGYSIITRRFAVRGGEIDVVALDGEVLCFIEVKMRTGGHEEAADAVGDLKAGRIIRAAEEFLARNQETNRAIRFDLVTISPDGPRLAKDWFRMG